MNLPAKSAPTGDVMESVIAKGDLAKLSPDERVRYYNAVCKSLGINPLTQPFAYIMLNGKLTLYATRTVLSGEGKELVELAKTNLRELDIE